MFIERFKIIQGVEPKTTNDAIHSAYIDLKNSVNAVVIVNLTQAVAHTTEVSLHQAKDILGTDEKAMIKDSPIWVKEDVSIETVTRNVGTGYIVEETAKNKQIIFQIDPSKLDINNGFTCISVKIGATAQPTNFASVDVILDSKYRS